MKVTELISKVITIPNKDETFSIPTEIENPEVGETSVGGKGPKGPLPRNKQNNTY